MSSDTDLLRQIIEKLADLPSALRQHVTDEAWARVPMYVDESLTAVLAAGGLLSVQPAIGGGVVITSIVAVLPSGATGLVQLGGTTIPVGQGLNVISPVAKLLGPSDTRSLSTDTAGTVALWLTGTQTPAYGVIS